MADVGGEYDPAAAGMNADELHARGVTADRMQGDPRRQLDRSVVELDPPREVEPHDADDILDLERAGEERMAHVMAGGVMQLGLLQMELRRRKAGKRADMVVMHVSQDNVGDVIAVE